MDEESPLKNGLCSYSAWLSEDPGTFRKPYKPELTKSVKRLSEIDIIGEKFSLTCTYVLEGCVLFHRIPWEKKGTHSEILDGYWNYVSA